MIYEWTNWHPFANTLSNLHWSTNVFHKSYVHYFSVIANTSRQLSLTSDRVGYLFFLYFSWILIFSAYPPIREDNWNWIVFFLVEALDFEAYVHSYRSFYLTYHPENYKDHFICVHSTSRMYFDCSISTWYNFYHVIAPWSRMFLSLVMSVSLAPSPPKPPPKKNKK